jgi:hypothetical protein
MKANAVTDVAMSKFIEENPVVESSTAQKESLPLEIRQMHVKTVSLQEYFTQLPTDITLGDYDPLRVTSFYSAADIDRIVDKFSIVYDNTANQLYALEYRSDHITANVDEAIRRIYLHFQNEHLARLASAAGLLANAGSNEEAYELQTRYDGVSYLDSCRLHNEYDDYHTVVEYTYVVEMTWKFFRPKGKVISPELQEEILFFFMEWISTSKDPNGAFFQDFCIWYRDIVRRIEDLHVLDTCRPTFTYHSIKQETKRGVTDTTTATAVTNVVDTKSARPRRVARPLYPSGVESTGNAASTMDAGEASAADRQPSIENWFGVLDTSLVETLQSSIEVDFTIAERGIESGLNQIRAFISSFDVPSRPEGGTSPSHNT